MCLRGHELSGKGYVGITHQGSVPSLINIIRTKKKGPGLKLHGGCKDAGQGTENPAEHRHPADVPRKLIVALVAPARKQSGVDLQQWESYRRIRKTGNDEESPDGTNNKALN